MFVQMIEFKSSEYISQSDVEEMIHSFVCSLKSNGQIISDYLLVKSDDIYLLYVTTPKADSLNPRFDSIDVKRDRDKIYEHFSIK